MGTRIKRTEKKVPWLGIKHAGRYVSKTPEYVLAAIARGELTAYRPRDQVAPRWVIHTDELDAWVRSWECSKERGAL